MPFRRFRCCSVRRLANDGRPHHFKAGMHRNAWEQLHGIGTGAKRAIASRA